MTTLDELLRKPVDPLPLPRLRVWRDKLAQPGAKAQVEVFGPPRGLGASSPEITLRMSENGPPPVEETVFWDDELNAGLIQLGVRAADAAQEAIRFSYVLRKALQLAARVAGDGYLNHALRYFLEDSDLRNYPEIADVLKDMRPAHLPPDDTIATIREMIADAISGRAHELRDQLGYPEGEAKAVLVKAIARYLDDRFSITYRRRMGAS